MSTKDNRTPKRSASAILPPASGQDHQQPNKGPQAISPAAAGSNLPAAQIAADSQTSSGGGDQAAGHDHRTTDSHRSHVVPGPILASPLLGVAADVLDDLEHVRCANKNRLRALTDKGEHGHGLTADHPDVARLSALVDAIAETEKQAVKNLQKVMRAHALGPWVAASTGVGEKQAARLLAVIRDPYWNELHDRPRTLRELNAYCGFHVVDGVAPKRQRGQKSNWNEDARKRLRLIADSCVKQSPERSKYRRIYDEARAKYDDAVHNNECVRCGPKGKPAQPGSLLSLGHQHARGLRAISKAVLRDLWEEARSLHMPDVKEKAA